MSITWASDVAGDWFAWISQIKILPRENFSMSRSGSSSISGKAASGLDVETGGV